MWLSPKKLQIIQDKDLMIQKAKFWEKFRFFCCYKKYLDFGNLFVLLPKSNWFNNFFFHYKKHPYKSYNKKLLALYRGGWFPIIPKIGYFCFIDNCLKAWAILEVSPE